MKAVYTIVLLLLSNIFMTFAWYGHLKFKDVSWLQNSSLPLIIVISWGIAFVEYCFQVPANRIGFIDNGGPFNLWQLKVIQEVITLTVFTLFTVLLFKNQQFTYNHLIGFIFLVLAVISSLRCENLFYKIVGRFTKYSYLCNLKKQTQTF